ncbi:hypothetical protein DFH06DRAFT_1352389 [Mycena polygramma]|nr:hypothetical protein DFH06DRAFT_1352389 [Mycena polygramma]
MDHGISTHPGSLASIRLGFQYRIFMAHKHVRQLKRQASSMREAGFHNDRGIHVSRCRQTALQRLVEDIEASQSHLNQLGVLLRDAERAFLSSQSPLRVNLRREQPKRRRPQSPSQDLQRGERYAHRDWVLHRALASSPQPFALLGVETVYQISDNSVSDEVHDEADDGEIPELVVIPCPGNHYLKPVDTVTAAARLSKARL